MEAIWLASEASNAGAAIRWIVIAIVLVVVGIKVFDLRRRAARRREDERNPDSPQGRMAARRARR